MKILPKKKLKVLDLATNYCTLKNNPNKTQYPQYIFFKSYVAVVFQRTLPFSALMPSLENANILLRWPVCTFWNAVLYCFSSIGNYVG